MVQLYAPIDLELSGDSYCSIAIDPDAELLGLGFDKKKGGKKIIDIKFQFPPKITSDSKSSDWTTRGRIAYEPIVTWNGANPRKVAIKMTYVVAGGEWTAERIRGITREFKRINYGIPGLKKSMAVMVIKIYGSDGIIGDGGKFRVSDVSVQYSESTVKASNSLAWPMITEITVQCELVTQTNVGDDGPKNSLLNLAKIALPKWY